MLLAILRIFPRRSFGLSFFGVDDGNRFLFTNAPFVLFVDDAVLGVTGVDDFFLLEFDETDESK